ncbi:tRNA uracil 4-sulfurtransferase ThiI [Alkalimarinus alittae]|uniref:tRNA sulfurtransferase n=1 Tax=Alkalimarinus alittae TaxID=2961619 RepID=A0ABY6N3M0_9ALTE|nr:tRNA uracil 4-sulfurtransferase ThiI [Alkalimarinus alittae]UZE96602.1 tRNA 4-thiouridine(8) synthase ThiI [Alkalimarinus alittae]
MKFIVKLFPEITIKSKPVRKQFVKQLKRNIRKILKRVDERIEVAGQWDKIEVDLPVELTDISTDVIDALQRIPGIANILQVTEHEYSDFDDILEKTRVTYAPMIAGKSFVVRVKRAGKHEFRSTDVERYVGGGLLKFTEGKSVDLHNPEVVVKLEIRDEKLYIIEKRYQGLGGFPIGCLDSVLSLISGGFDSTVSSFLTMRRGLRTHFCFFNLGGSAHEIGVKQVSLHLWEQYGSSHKVKFVTVPFEEVVAEILKSVHHSQMGVVLKRMMLRAASQVAEQMSVQALVTGESVAQVSSQTLTNLSVIDKVTDTLVLRPLITMDKPEIIRISAEIGTEDFAKTMPEYCGVISDRPTTRAKIEKIEREEERFDFAVLDKAVEDQVWVTIDQVLDSIVTVDDVEIVSTPSIDDVIVDIRHPDEAERKPLHLTNNKIISIPFFELMSKTQDIDLSKRYLLYCEKGTMSQLHASHLKGEGFDNVLVYRG